MTKPKAADPCNKTTEAEIVRQAREHNNRYLLPHRYRRPGPWVPMDEKDRLYEACENLVMRREARWLQGDMAPGIELLK